MAGKASHVVTLIVGVGVLFVFFLVVELIDKEYKIFLFELFTIYQWGFTDTKNGLLCLLAHLNKFPPLIVDLFHFVVKSFAIVIGKIAFVVDLGAIFFGGVDHVLQEK